MNVVALLKFLYDSKLLALAPGWAALVIIGYIEAWQIPEVEAQVAGIKDSIDAVQIASLEERLDAAYTALCDNKGDPAILERIRELQQAYDRLVDPEKPGNRYDEPSCELLQKLK